MRKSFGLPLRPIARAAMVALGGLAVSPVLLAQQQQAGAAPQRIEITGSNIKRTNLETLQPVLLLDRETIQRSGATTLTEVLNAVPVVSGGAFNEATGAGNSFAPGTAAVSLRGLGVNTALVLLNGRRVAGYGFAQNINEAFVDLNSIPVSAIERIDILKDGASAIYGSDAISGVINIILRRDFKGFEVSGMAGTTQDGGGSETRGSLAAGFGDMAKNKFNVMATLDFFTREKLSSQDRSYSRSADQSAKGGYDQRSPTGNPGTWVTSAGYIPFAKCPADRNTEAILGVPTCAYDFAADNWLLPKTQRLGAFVRGVAEITPAVQLFAEAGYSNNVTNQSAAPTPGSFAVPAANPSNPYGTAVTAIYRLVDVGPRLNEIDSTNTRLVAGARGTLGNWDWEVAGNVSKNEVTNTGTNYVDIRTIRSAIAGTLAGFTGTYYNLTDNSKNSEALLNTIRYSPVRKGTSELSGFDFKASRELMKLGGGMAALAVGGDSFKESIADVPDLVSQTGNIVGSGGTSSSGSRKRSAVFAELSLPLFKGFESQIAVRYDDYSDFGGKASPKIGASYRPTSNTLIRAGYGNGFRAPSLVELYLGQSTAFPNVRDTPRCSAYTAAFGATDARTRGVCGSPQVRTIFAGNPKLEAEESESTFLGFVVDITNNISLSLDYYDIKHNNLVTSPTASYVIANFAACPPGGGANCPNRAAPNANDILANAPGALFGTATTDPNTPGIYRSFFNSLQQSTSGVDMEIRARNRLGSLGRLTTTFNATYVTSLKRQINPGSALTELVNTYEYPRVRGSLTGTLDTGNWSATARYNWRAKFQQAYQEVYTHVSEHGTLDLQLAYRGFKNMTLSGGATNVLNRKPPFSDEAWTGYADSVDSPRGAFYYMNVSFSFK